MSDLLSGLSRETRLIVVTEAIRLLALLPDDPNLEDTQALRRAHLPEDGALRGTDRVLKNLYPLAAMLLARPRPDRPRVQEMDILRAWALVATLRFCATTGQTDRHSRPTSGLRVVRRLIGKKYATDLFSALPPFEHSLPALMSALQQAASNARGRDPAAHAKLEPLQLLIRGAHFVREPAVRRRNTAEAMSPKQPDLIVDAQGDLTAVYQTADPDPNASAEEQVEDRDLLYYRFATPLPADQRHRVQFQLQSDLFEAEERERGWTGDFAALSDQEARSLWSNALSADHQGADWALACLLFGRNVFEAGHDPTLGNSWWDDGALWFAPDMPLTSAKSFERNRLALVPPEGLRRRFTRLGCVESGRAQLTAWLKSLDTARPIGLSHLTRALRDAMAREDVGVVGLLAGRSVKDVVQMYYTRVHIDQLRDIWGKALNNRFGAQIEADIHAPTLMVGSLKVPSPRLVKTYFEGLLDLAATPERHRRLELNGAVQQFADLSNFVAAVLNFLTARRPHRMAFEPFDQITGQTRPRVFLTGKGGRLVDDGRWVPLCTTATQLISVWRAHCQTLATSAIAAFPDLRRALQGAAQGTDVPFFSWDSATSAPRPLRATDLWDRAGVPAKRGPAAAPNWNRHYIRSALVARHVPGHVIDGFMGHGGTAMDPFAPVSAMTLADSDGLRTTLEEIWQDLEIDLTVICR